VKSRKKIVEGGVDNTYLYVTKLIDR